MAGILEMKMMESLEEGDGRREHGRWATVT